MEDAIRYDTIRGGGANDDAHLYQRSTIECHFESHALYTLACALGKKNIRKRRSDEARDDCPAPDEVTKLSSCYIRSACSANYGYNCRSHVHVCRRARYYRYTYVQFDLPDDDGVYFVNLSGKRKE